MSIHIPKLLIATHNPGKRAEFQRLLTALPSEITDLSAVGIRTDVEETGDTYHDNALLKAHAYAQQSGMWTLADDSGLEVLALDNRPGVYTARYAGKDTTYAEKWALLFSELAGKQGEERAARFRCVLALVSPAGEAWLFEGVCDGQIATAPAGVNGFGYDPIFYLPELACTMAELPLSDKDFYSHRGQACQKLINWLARP
ncbi:MAG TPA: RdgB/HAM1 family non-canonical purine NTP pyrophosphatase [Anaerolineales bacterium]|nr:RdgB/HAM1 family non-canonical purine NTP pyrophosphatase [Anaerolineales bacterium]